MGTPVSSSVLTISSGERFSSCLMIERSELPCAAMRTFLPSATSGAIFSL